MSVFDRIANRRRGTNHDVQARVTCLRCRREYTPEPDVNGVDEHCWWCAARVSSPAIPIVAD